MQWRHKPPATRLFTQPFVQIQNIKSPCQWPLWGKFTGDRYIWLIPHHQEDCMPNASRNPADVREMHVLYLSSIQFEKSNLLQQMWSSKSSRAYNCNQIQSAPTFLACFLVSLAVSRNHGVFLLPSTNTCEMTNKNSGDLKSQIEL